MFTKDMNILDIVADYPETEKNFAQYDHIAGKCIMCHHLFDSLEGFADQYELDLVELISKLNDSVGQ